MTPTQGGGGSANGTFARQTPVETPLPVDEQLIACGVALPGPELWTTLPAPLPESWTVS